MISKETRLKEFWITSGFVYLLVVAILGVLMRSIPFITLPTAYHHILHAHSHTALLGWSFVMASAVIMNSLKVSFYQFKREIIILSIAIVGMLISFLYQGYGAISIAFSTVFVLTSYVLLFRIYREVSKLSNRPVLISWAIIWYFVSTLGIWCIGPISVILGKDHVLYELAIQFFLHFQINGWLTFVALSILFHYSKKELTNVWIYALNLSLLFTFSINIYWVYDSMLLYMINVIGVVLQIAFYSIACLHLWKNKVWSKQENGFNWFYGCIVIFIVSKPIIQLVTIIPNFLETLQHNRFLIIAFLHLILIGFVSFSFVYYCLREKYLLNNGFTQLGVITWILGFIITEILIALQGFGIYHLVTPYLLLAFSIIMMSGIAILLFSRIRTNSGIKI